MQIRLIGLALLLGSSCLPRKATLPKGIRIAGALANYTPSKVELFDLDALPDGTAWQGIPYSWSPTVLVENIRFSAVNLPSWAKIDPLTGQISGTPQSPGQHNNISVRASLGEVYSEVGPFSIAVIGDTLAQSQWHLRNTGREDAWNNAGIPGTFGVSLNLERTLARSIRGSGVRVMISASGLQLNHPDIINNIDIGASKNYLLPPPYFGDPGVHSSGIDHGTSLAGIIAAEGWNGVGIRGVAPEALVAGNNFHSPSVLNKSLYEVDQASGDYDIFNFGYSKKVTGGPDSSMSEALRRQLESGFKGLRHGNGASYVKAAGDEYNACDSGGSLYNFGGVCAPQDANLEGANQSVYQIVVGATNAHGIKTAAANAGSNLWVSAPVGTDGVNGPAVLTTDVSGCNRGATRTYFDANRLGNNIGCHYTNSYGGTAAASAMVTGVVALILSANTGLTSRDVKHILASTARRVDGRDVGGRHPGGLAPSGYAWRQGWVNNAAGYAFNNSYGFGLVDVDAAVDMALEYTMDLGEFVEQTASSTRSVAIPDNNATGATDRINVLPADGLIIEAVEIVPNITHGRPGELGIELSSPSGTKSILLSANNSLLLATNVAHSPSWGTFNGTGVALVSNAFYGESSVGQWTIRLVDALGNRLGSYRSSPYTGTLNGWSLTIYGRRP